MRKNFTLIEIVIVVIILAVLVSAAIPIYHNAVESAKERVCVVNQQALLGAVEIYALENDELPADISKLRKEHIEKAWAKVSKQGGWKLKLAYFIVDLDKQGLAYAWVENYLGDLKHLRCPKAPPGANSYGLNQAIITVPPMSHEAYENYLKSYPTTIIIADAGGTTFDDTDLTTYSHRHEKYIISQLQPEKRALGIRKRNVIMAIDEAGEVEPLNYGQCKKTCSNACDAGDINPGTTPCDDYCKNVYCEHP